MQKQKQANKCAECGGRLIVGARACPECQAPIDTMAPAPKPAHSPLCEFTHNGQRCPLWGTNSRGKSGEGPWYCTLHIRATKVEGIAILQKLIENPKQVIAIKAEMARRGAPPKTKYYSQTQINPEAIRAQISDFLDRIRVNRSSEEIDESLDCAN